MLKIFINTFQQNVKPLCVELNAARLMYERFCRALLSDVKPEMRVMSLGLALGVGAYAAVECAKSFNK